MASNLSELLFKFNNSTGGKIGSTTTVNEQVDEMEVQSIFIEEHNVSV